MMVDAKNQLLLKSALLLCTSIAISFHIFACWNRDEFKTLEEKDLARI